MSNKVKRFGELERLAESRELEASRRLASSIESLRTKQAELDQLRRYLEEYRSQPQEQNGKHSANHDALSALNLPGNQNE